MIPDMGSIRHAQAAAEPQAWTRWISGVESKDPGCTGSNVRVVDTGVLFDAIVTGDRVGMEALDLMRNEGLAIGPTAVSRDRMQVLVPVGVEQAWDAILDHWSAAGGVTLRCVGAGGHLWLPRPGREDPRVFWAVPPTLGGRGLPVLTEPLAFVTRLNLAAINVANAGA